MGNMKHLGLVAIVRKVYQANSQPKMGILFPRIEEGEIAVIKKKKKQIKIIFFLHFFFEKVI